MSSSLGWCSLTPGFGKVSTLLFIDSESRFSILPNQNCKWELSVTILERSKFEEGKKIRKIWYICKLDSRIQILKPQRQI